MNKIEWIIKEIQGKIDDYREKYPEKSKDDKWVIPKWEKQLEFYKWILADSDAPPVWELHDRRPSPTVWGMGDVTYNLNLQLTKMDTSSSPKILIFDYSEFIENHEEEKE